MFQVRIAGCSCLYGQDIDNVDGASARGNAFAEAAGQIAVDACYLQRDSCERLLEAPPARRRAIERSFPTE